MKKHILIFLAFFVSTIALSTEPVFDLNQSEINQTFNNLTQLESFILNNPDLSVDEIKTQNSKLLDNVSFETSSNLSLAGDMPIVGSFWWGCILGIVGLLVVYLVTDHDKEETKKAFIGCIIGTLIFGGVFALSSSLTWF
jgi:hypothetical protein